MTAIAWNGGRYEVTDADRLWLLRAVQAEGPVQADVARALVNLFAFLRSQGDQRTLTQVIRAYAQPVNPRWFQSGDLFKAAAAATTTQDALAVALDKARNRELVHSARTSFTQHVVQAVELALTQPFRSDVTDYAAAHVDATHKGYESRSTPRTGRNRLWTRAVGWAGYLIEGSGGGTAAGLLLFAVFVAAWAARRG